MGNAVGSVAGICYWQTLVTGRQLIVFLLRVMCSNRRRKITIFHRRYGPPTRMCAIIIALYILTKWMVYISSHSRVDEGVTVGSYRFNLFIFADDLLRLVSSEQGIQHAFDRFSAACKQGGLKISTNKPRYYVSRRPIQCALQISSNTFSWHKWQIYDFWEDFTACHFPTNVEQRDLRYVGHIHVTMCPSKDWRNKPCVYTHG